MPIFRIVLFNSNYAAVRIVIIDALRQTEPIASSYTEDIFVKELSYIINNVNILLFIRLVLF